MEKLSNHWDILGPPREVTHWWVAVGKMNFVEGWRVCSHFPEESVALSVSRPKSWPEPPRSWRNIRVWVWVEMGGMVNGGVKGDMGDFA